MSAFYSSSFTEDAVLAAWRERKTKLLAKQLQDANDYLYSVVEESILGRRTELLNALLDAINTAPSSQNISVPLWSYHTAHYKDRYRNIVGTPAWYTMETRLRRKGYHWVVGRVDRYKDPQELLRADDGTWDYIWGWTSVPRSVHDVVRRTDFRQRIALLFGDDRYRVSYRVTHRKVLTRPLGVVVEKVELRLHFHPRGLYDRSRKALLDTKLKYESHVPEPEDWRIPYVWTGVDAETPGLSNEPVTPPMPPPPTEPPALARRTNGGGIHPPTGDESPVPMTDEVRASWNAFVQRVEADRQEPGSGSATPASLPPLISMRSNGGGIDAAAGRLDFGIHEYSGPDALQRAARDTIASCVDELAPCHCGYHHPEEE
jgi:hypothetical protein